MDTRRIIVAIVTSDFGTISSLIDQVRYPADSLTAPRASAHEYPLLTLFSQTLSLLLLLSLFLYFPCHGHPPAIPLHACTLVPQCRLINDC